MKFSALTDSFQPNILQALEQKRKQMQAAGRDVINLSTGTPDLPPDPHVLAAMAEAVSRAENYKYSLCDLPALQDAVLDWYRNRYGVSLERDEVVAVYGSQEGIAHIAFVLCDPGDAILVGTPGYPIFSFGPLLAKAELLRVPLRQENGFLFDFDAVDPAAARAAKAIIVSYPNNPLAVPANEDFYARLVRFAKKYDLVAIHDNAYSEYIHDGAPGGSFLATPGAKDIGIEFNSLSKSYNLSGLRVSFALGNRDVLAVFRNLRSQIDYGLSLPDQYAAIAALTGSQAVVLRNRAAYRERRDALCDGLQRIGWYVPRAQATMFCWFPTPNGQSSRDFAMRLLEQAGVICVPGDTFGEGGEGYLRFALVEPKERIERAVRCIAESAVLG